MALHNHSRRLSIDVWENDRCIRNHSDLREKDFRGLSKCDPHTPDLREKYWSPSFFLGPLAENSFIHTCMFGQFVSPVTLVIHTFMIGGALSQ